MRVIVWITSSTTPLPRVATSAACSASRAACVALSALCFTLAVISSMLDAVCTSAAACCSVRCDRSVLPAAISDAPTLMFSVPLRTRETVSTRPLCIVRARSSRLVVSFGVNAHGRRQVAARDAVRRADRQFEIAAEIALDAAQDEQHRDGREPPSTAVIASQRSALA